MSITIDWVIQMKQNDFYEVDGCMDFIPVTIGEVYDDGVIVTVSNAKRNCTLVVEEVCRFPKVNEPQTVVVPKFVAEWLEECKRSGWHLQKVLSRLDDDEKVGDWAYDENDDLIPEKVDMIARAWLDGFEIEREKLYTVEIPDPNGKGINRVYLGKSNPDSKVFIYKGNFNPNEDKFLWLTEDEIKQDFEWAWQWAKEVE